MLHISKGKESKLQGKGELQLTKGPKIHEGLLNGRLFSFCLLLCENLG